MYTRMLRLICEVAMKGGAALGIAWLAVSMFDILLTFGASPSQTVVVLGFYLYCAIVLIVATRHRLFHILAIPVLTQFLHLFQKYNFPAGANSFWRLLPFVIVDVRLLSGLLLFRPQLTITEKLVVVAWVVLNFLFIAISPNLEGIAAGAFILFLLTLPAYFLVLSIYAQQPGFLQELEQSLGLLFVILAIGTFGLVIAGVQYRAADNLLVTRNITDTNVTMAYFILLWPFALLYSMRRRFAWLPISVLVVLFAAVVVLSFSRGAVFIVTPYVAASLLMAGGRKSLIPLVLTGAGAAVVIGRLVTQADSDIAYPWQLRFGEVQSAGPVLRKLHEASGRAEIHQIAYQLFRERPAWGHGTASFEKLGPGYREAHSLFYTLLAEQGLVGTAYLYALLAVLGFVVGSAARRNPRFWLLPAAWAAYLLFVHSVGSVFVIIPSESLTINCIAPILLICLYFYAKASHRRSDEIA